MAADSMSVMGGMKIFNEIKLHRVRGAVIGLAGGSGALTFLDWYKAGSPALKYNEHPTFNEDASFLALVATKKGLFMADDTLRLEQVFEPFFAIGSGKGEAIAAMHCGKNAIQAVQIAARIDSNTGGRVRYMRVE